MELRLQSWGCRIWGCKVGVRESEREFGSAEMAAGRNQAHVEEVSKAVEAVGLSEDAGQNLKLNQATFFRCVENGNLSALGSLLKNRNVDVNAYNDEVNSSTCLDLLVC